MEADQILIEIVKYLFITGISILFLSPLPEIWREDDSFALKMIFTLILVILVLVIWALFLKEEPILWK